MDGHTFVKKLRSFKVLSAIPIVVFTTKEGLKNAFRIEGVDDYVVKTIDGVDMIAKIKEIIRFKKEFFND
jgi:DNA-binding response OmpR family regulator